MASSPISSWQIDGETVETVTDFIFLGSKITADGDCSHEIKRRFLLGRKAMNNLKVKVTQSCLTLFDPMDYSVHGILQPRIVEWVAFPFSRGSSQPRDQSQVSRIAGRFVTIWATREAQELHFKCTLNYILTILTLSIHEHGIFSIYLFLHSFLSIVHNFNIQVFLFFIYI